jgi:hypothetical protein
MNRPGGKSKNQIGYPPLYIGFQWGEPSVGEDSLRVEKVGGSLRITAARPDYLSENRPWDFIGQYEKARKKPSINKLELGKDSPHIEFANAKGDDELITFVRKFGPIVANSWKMLPITVKPGPVETGDSPLQILMRARQDFQELRAEQKIFRASLALVAELGKKDSEYDFESTKRKIAEIGEGIADWPRQWARERKQRHQYPRWKISKESIGRIVHLSRSKRGGLAPQVDARIVLCELINAFPALAFPNPPEMHFYLRFGIRPLLYTILRREFFQPRDVAICANSQCRAFFEVQRAGQRFCNAVCSRRHRQRDYWEVQGKTLRQVRLANRAERI